MSDPITITSDQVRAAYDALGLDPDVYADTMRIDVDGGRITITRLRRNSDGRLSGLTQTTEAAIKWLPASSCGQ